MSESMREQAQFRKEKAPILAKYVVDHAKTMAEIAGRGFLSLPGYAFDIENSLEFITKMGLSEINYKIMAETIERELKQAGIDYGQAYSNAAMIWELNKQSLMATWDSELAWIKRGEAAEEEELEWLAIEVSKRANILLERKTELELESEDYRQDLVELDGATADSEVQLANAKLLTAQKKLEIIPILEEIIVKEEELLVTEGLKAAEYTKYMAAEVALAAKKGTLAPFINEYATSVQNYTDKIITRQIPLEGQIADEKITQAGIAITKSVYRVEGIEIEKTVADKNLTLMDTKKSLQETKFNSEQGLIIQDTADIVEIKTSQGGSFEATIGAERTFGGTAVSNKQTIHLMDNNTREESSSDVSNVRRNAQTSITNIDVDEMMEEARIKAKGEITAMLTHLIG